MDAGGSDVLDGGYGVRASVSDTEFGVGFGVDVDRAGGGGNDSIDASVGVGVVTAKAGGFWDGAGDVLSDVRVCGVGDSAGCRERQRQWIRERVDSWVWSSSRLRLGLARGSTARGEGQRGASEVV